MKAVVYDAARSYAVKQIPAPEAGAGQVLIKVDQVGVCGTDLHIHEGDFNAVFPLIPGHELVGVVDRIGDDVRRFVRGDRGLTGAVATRMAANVLLDTTLGAIPFVGDVFDVFFKANTRNIKLLQQVQLERSLHQEASSWRSILVLGVIALVFLTLLALLLIGFVAVVAWLFRDLHAR